MTMLNGFATKLISIIDRLGTDMVLRSYTLSGTSFDPTRTPSDTTVRAVTFDYSNEERFDSTIQKDDRLFLVAANTPVTKQDKIVDGSKEYHIISIENIGPGDEVFHYRIQARL